MTTVQLENPAQLGRKQRLTEFREYIEANRKSKRANQIIAEYSIQTGLSLRLVKSYMQLFYDAGFYTRPRFNTKFMILTQAEHDALAQE